MFFELIHQQFRKVLLKVTFFELIHQQFRKVLLKVTFSLFKKSEILSKSTIDEFQKLIGT